MKKLARGWLDGLFYIVVDNTTSFYTFFTTILAECFYLWAFQKSTVTISVSLILLGYILNVVIFARLKGKYECKRLELTFSILYSVTFCVLFISGCIINFRLIAIMTAVSLFMAILSATATFLQIVYTSKLVLLWMLFRIIVVILPLVAFVVLLSKIPGITSYLKVIIPALYLICSPFISLYEYKSAACNIFELSYNVTWEESVEKYHNSLLQEETYIHVRK